MDPFAGNTQDPISLHKYLYAHSNPINTLDPTGLFSLSELNVVQAVKTVIRNPNATHALRVLDRVDNLIDFIENVRLFTDIWLLVVNSQDIRSQLKRLQNIANLNGNATGSDWAKLRGLETEHLQEVIAKLLSEAPTILGYIGNEHKQTLKKVAKHSTRRTIRRRPKLVIGLPSLPGDYQGRVLLPGRIGPVGPLSVRLSTSKNGLGGSLFSVGFKFQSDPLVHQVFRLDYHGQKDPSLRRQYGTAAQIRLHGNAYLLGSQSGIGPHIQGVGRPKFHYHIPDRIK